eukprot:gene2309-4499_t
MSEIGLCLTVEEANARVVDLLLENQRLKANVDKVNEQNYNLHVTIMASEVELRYEAQKAEKDLKSRLTFQGEELSSLHRQHQQAARELEALRKKLLYQESATRPAAHAHVPFPVSVSVPAVQQPPPPPRVIETVHISVDTSDLIDSTTNTNVWCKEGGLDVGSGTTTTTRDPLSTNGTSSAFPPAPSAQMQMQRPSTIGVGAGITGENAAMAILLVALLPDICTSVEALAAITMDPIAGSKYTVSSKVDDLYNNVPSFSSPMGQTPVRGSSRTVASNTFTTTPGRSDPPHTWTMRQGGNSIGIGIGTGNGTDVNLPSSSRVMVTTPALSLYSLSMSEMDDSPYPLLTKNCLSSSSSSSSPPSAAIRLILVAVQKAMQQISETNHKTTNNINDNGKDDNNMLSCMDLVIAVCALADELLSKGRSRNNGRSHSMHRHHSTSNLADTGVAACVRVLRILTTHWMSRRLLVDQDSNRRHRYPNPNRSFETDDMQRNRGASSTSTSGIILNRNKSRKRTRGDEREPVPFVVDRTKEELMMIDDNDDDTNPLDVSMSSSNGHTDIDIDIDRDTDDFLCRVVSVATAVLQTHVAYQEAYYEALLLLSSICSLVGERRGLLAWMDCLFEKYRINNDYDYKEEGATRRTVLAALADDVCDTMSRTVPETVRRLEARRGFLIALGNALRNDRLFELFSMAQLGSTMSSSFCPQLCSGAVAVIATIPGHTMTCDAGGGNGGANGSGDNENDKVCQSTATAAAVANFRWAVLRFMNTLFDDHGYRAVPVVFGVKPNHITNNNKKNKNINSNNKNSDHSQILSKQNQNQNKDKDKDKYDLSEQIVSLDESKILATVVGILLSELHRLDRRSNESDEETTPRVTALEACRLLSNFDSYAKPGLSALPKSQRIHTQTSSDINTDFFTDWLAVQLLLLLPLFLILEIVKLHIIMARVSMGHVHPSLLHLNGEALSVETNFITRWATLIVMFSSPLSNFICYRAVFGLIERLSRKHKITTVTLKYRNTSENLL